MIGSRFFILLGCSRNENGVLEMESGENHEKNSPMIAFAKIHVLFGDPSLKTRNLRGVTEAVTINP